MDDSTERTLTLQRNLQKFIDKVDELRNEDDPSGDGFTREFIEIRDHGQKMKAQNTYPAEEGKKSCNIKKNRYRDILPFDETRVKLAELPGEEGSDYINANFIKNHLEQTAYIASQGPLPHTVNDFWRMVMENNIKVVAMACQVTEMGRVKCAQYWPEEVGEDNKEEFGSVTVTMLSEEEISENCIKRELKAVQRQKEHLVIQFHYTYWPDHDIPKDFDAILGMMAEMRQIRANDPDKSPYLVHCSAGCGRTGTICAIDYSWEILQTGNLTDEFSLYNITMEMREQRQSMIQTPDQYMMAHVIIQQLFQKHLELMEDHTYGNVEFQGEESVDGEDTASVSSIKSTSRKNSLNQEIELTWRKLSGDNLSLNDSKSLSNEQSGTPISPITEEPQEFPKSPIVKEMAAKYSVEKIENIPNKKPIQAQASLTSDGKKKHVTTISIGGASKQPLGHTKSNPAVQTNTNTSNIARAKTVPTVKDKPQSSIPPTIPTQSSGSVYSYARTTEPTNVTDSNSYSAISNYSSVKQTNQNAGRDSAATHTYHVLEKSGEATPNKPGIDGSQLVYSMAKEPEPNMYSSVSKPKVNGTPKQNGVQMDDVYEAVQVGEKGPPPIPNRGYLDDEPNNNNNHKDKPPLGAGDQHSVGKTKQFMSNLKSVFTGGKSQTGNDSTLPSEIPGFKQKIGSKPKGPRDPPWKKK